MKQTRFIIGITMSIVNAIFGFTYLFQGKPDDTERIMGLLWLIFALI